MTGKLSALRHAGPVFSRLRVRLLLLVLMAILPALLLVLYGAVEQRRLAKVEAGAQAMRLARLAANTQKQHIEAARQFLAALSGSREVRPENAAACAALFTNLLPLHPVYANIGAIDRDGWTFASALPTAERVFLGDRAYFKLARDSRRAAIGEYQVGRITRKATINVGHPLFEKGSTQFLGVVFVAIDLRWLEELTSKAELPDGSTLTVLDRNGVVLIRQVIPGGAGKEPSWAGRSATNLTSVVNLLHKGGEDAGVAVGLDGVERLYASTPLTRTLGVPDAHVIIGVPTRVAYAAAHRILVQNLIFLGIASVLTLGAAWVGGDLFVLRQVRGLVTATRRVQSGDLAARSGVEPAPGELGLLAKAFDEMAASLEQRVAELQRAQAELKALNESLEQRVGERTVELKRSNEDLEQFAYVTSHDLQEPLRMVSSYVQLLRERYGDTLDADGREFLGYAYDGAVRMQELIQGLLTYARVGTRQREFQALESGEACDDAIANLKVAIEEAGAGVTRDPLPVVRGDPIQLIQLFQNLIGNGIKFRGARPPQVHVSARRTGRDWEFTVRDNGIGIDKRDFDRIFIVFQRLHSRQKYPGTGIGLSVCKKIVERHGGRIWVESAPGEGTTFHFTLPAEESATPG